MNNIERFLIVALLIAEFACRRQLADQGRRPVPELSPLEVVKIQVYALEHYNEPRPNAGIWTAFQFGAFLAAFSRCGSLSKAAKRAKVDRRTHYNWLKDDSWYLQAFRQGD
jgi:hypothetical protein